MRVLASKVFRTGKQQLEWEDGRFYVSIRNRTYRSRVEIPESKARIWYNLLRKSPFS